MDKVIKAVEQIRGLPERVADCEVYVDCGFGYK